MWAGKSGIRRTVICLLLSSMLLADAILADDSVEAPTAGEPGQRFEVVTLRGRVVWLAEAMARRSGVKTVPEAADRVLALETAQGHLHPIVEDIRGRGFRRDERLRKMDLELSVRRYQGTPFVQVIRAFELTKERKLELDYWCDICAIAMFELKPCDCCQGEIELRRRVVGNDGRTAD